MVTRKLFIEGADAPKTVESSFRAAFSKLLSQKITARPRINMCGGKTEAIRQFLNSKTELSVLIVDLDAPPANRNADLANYKLSDHAGSVVYMIQEMEGWILSQPEVLDKYYGTEVSKRITKKHGSEFAEPDKELMRITKDTKKGEYHKVKHGIDLVEMLNAEKLAKDFPDDFGRLIDLLSK